MARAVFYLLKQRIYGSLKLMVIDYNLAVRVCTSSALLLSYADLESTTGIAPAT